MLERWCQRGGYCHSDVVEVIVGVVFVAVAMAITCGLGCSCPRFAGASCDVVVMFYQW